MKKIYVKYTILVNGLNIIGEYNIDNFLLKKGYINENYFNEFHNISTDGMQIDLNLYATSFINDFEDMSYRYFESIDYFEFDVSNKTIVTKEKAFELIEKYPEICEIPNNFEKKLRLTLNVPLYFAIIRINLYDENRNYKFFICDNKTISSENRCHYNLDPNVFHNNSRFHMNYKEFECLNNNNYKRALEFYNDSFESNKISTRFILIFSSLEAIFNLDTKSIEEKLARYSAKLLSEDNKEIYNLIKENIKKLYRKRSNYIHGSKIGDITTEDEKLLREYVRKIIISYWMIASIKKESSKQILRYLDSDELLDIQIRLVITSLNSYDFKSQQYNLISIIENDYGITIPEETKKNILSKTGND